jgi:thioredoxin 1
MTEPDAIADAPLRRRSVLRRMPWGTILLIIAFLGVWSWLGRTAPTPPVFDEGVTLASAVDAAAADRFVFAVATADWCGPCQGYKRNALTDERVEQWIADNAVPVYINVDRRPEDAAALGVSAIPATFLLKDGQIVAGASGAMGADALLDWLNDAARN